MLVRCLSTWGWSVDEAPRITTALELFTRGSYDLVLCDVDLPDGDGITLSRALLKTNPSLAVIIISGSAENVERAREAGLPRLKKPFPLEELRELIESGRSGKWRRN